MSSRSLNGQDLNLHNLTVTNNLILNDATVDDLIVTNNTTTLDLSVNGVATCETLNVDQNLDVSGTALLNGDVSMNNNCEIAGDLTVLGTLSANINSSMEIVYFNMTGNAGTVTQTMTLSNNIEATTDYSVFPSFYYGFTGSGGTYDITATSSSVNQIMITNRQAGSFEWYITKTTGDNINVYIVFLVIYGVSSSAYPSIYS